ncbi:MAG: hypothetical protein R3E31_08610 [Chloroflexota bacterium]
MRIDPFAGHPYRKRAWGEGLLWGPPPFFAVSDGVCAGNFGGWFAVGCDVAMAAAGIGAPPMAAANAAEWGVAAVCLALALSILVTADRLTLPKATGLLLGLTVWRYLTWRRKQIQALVAATWEALCWPG